LASIAASRSLPCPGLLYSCHPCVSSRDWLVEDGPWGQGSLGSPPSARPGMRLMVGWMPDIGLRQSSHFRGGSSSARRHKGEAARESADAALQSAEAERESVEAMAMPCVIAVPIPRERLGGQHQRGEPPREIHRTDSPGGGQRMLSLCLWNLGSGPAS
jgi:hypothetical protein